MKKNYGFTLIELLIVMAILGVLAVVVLVAINPVQQLARTRDAGRKSAVTQIGRALEAFYTSHGGRYLNGTNCDTEVPVNPVFSNADDWLTCLKNSGEISTEPGLIRYTVSGTDVCGLLAAPVLNSEQNGLCYSVTGAAAADRAVVYARMESLSESSKCPSGSTYAYFVWSTLQGRGGLACYADSTSLPSPQIINFID